MSDPTFDLDQADYQETRHVFELWQWINTQLRELDKRPNSDPIYFERKGKYLKALIEEAIPIAHLGLHFIKPTDDVFIECKIGGQPYDGVLEVRGFNNLKIKVEVTVTEDYISSLQRELLSQQGFVHLTGPIRKRKVDGIIENEAEGVDSLEADNALRDLAFARFKAKAESNKYDKETAILVYVNQSRTLPVCCRAELVWMTWDYLITHHPAIYGVYYCYGSDIDAVREKDYWHRP